MITAERDCPTCGASLGANALVCQQCGTATPTAIAISDGNAETPEPTHFAESTRLAAVQEAVGDLYDVRRLLGRGGFAEVFVAFDKRLKREIALKAIRGDLIVNQTLLERFQREAEAVAKLRHPNVVPIFSVGESRGVAYFTMPLIEGETLTAALEREGRIGVRESARILRQAAFGLHAAHQAGIVHRDVKPDNIMLEGVERTVVVTDFGIAKTAGGKAEGLTGAGFVLGTPHYMSPEQAMGEKAVGAPSDQYALATVGYRMLTGRTPFDAGSLQSLLFKTITEVPPEACDVSPEVPREFSNALARALSKQSEDRFGSMAEFAAALESFETASTAGLNKQTTRGGSPPDLASRIGAIRASASHLPKWMWAFPVIASALVLFIPPSQKAIGEELRKQPIAVLPCTEDTLSIRLAGVGDRWSEELADKLIRIGGLHIKSWSSVAGYRNSPLPTTRIAKDLGAGTIVRCRITEGAGGVGFKVEVIRATDDVTIWSSQYGGLGDPQGASAIQVAAARDIASQFGLSVSPPNLAALSRPMTHDSMALRLYRVGRFLLESGDDTEKRSIGYFEKAIARDSSFAAAYASLAGALFSYAEAEATPSQLYYPRVGWLARKAISLDPGLAAAHSMYASYLLNFTYDWQGAEEEHQKAIAADPGSGRAYMDYSWHLLQTERLEEAADAAARALELDPINLEARSQLIRALVFQGKHDEALRLIPEGLELRQDFEPYHYLLASIRMARGQRDSALASAERIQFPHWPPSAWLKSQLGRRDAAVAVLDTLLQRNRSIPVDPAHIAWIMVGIGDSAGALDWLEHAHRDRSNLLLYLLGPHPAFDGLRNHPRFRALRKQAGFSR